MRLQISYAAGDRVCHGHYGDGTVTGVNEYHTVIEFDAHGSRRFATPLVRLDPSATPPPPKPTKTRRRAVPRTAGSR